MTDDQRAKYAALVALRNTEATLRWTRSQLFIFIHAAGLTLVVTQRQLGPIFLLLAGVFGLILTMCWILATRRANQWLSFWHKQLAAAENPPPEQEITIFGSESYARVTRGRLTISRMLIVLIILFTMFWIAVLAWSVL